jgi:hypothetical protein
MTFQRLPPPWCWLGEDEDAGPWPPPTSRKTRHGGLAGDGELRSRKPRKVLPRVLVLVHDLYGFSVPEEPGVKRAA